MGQKSLQMQFSYHTGLMPVCGGAAWTWRRVRDYECMADTLAGFHFLAFALVLLARFIALMAELTQD